MRLHSLLALSLFAPGVAVAQATGSPPPTIVPQPPTKLPLKRSPEPTEAAITAGDLMTRLYIFSDDSMQGREAGTIGNVKGTDYIAREAERIGLKPAGDNGGYFQTIPFMTRTLATSSTVSVGGAPLTLGTEWAATGPESATGSDVPVVYGGTLGDSSSLPVLEQAAGKVVVFGLGPNSFRAFSSMGRLASSAAALALVVPPNFLGFFARPSQFVDDPASPAARPSRLILFLGPSAVGKMFATPLVQMTPGTAGKPMSFDVHSSITPVEYPARNVVAILPGSDAKLRDEYVAIGAHNDHIGFDHTPVDHDSIRIYNHIVRPEGAENQAARATPEQQAQVNAQLAEWRASHPGSARPDSIFNGADDDGSGSVSVLEIAQKLAAGRHPKRSILFVWHVGEEKGLLGSTYFTDHPTVPRDSIVAQLNLDMVGRGDAWDITGTTKDGTPIHGNPNYLQLVGSRRLSTELGDLIEKVNADDKHGLVFDYSLDANGHPANIYCRSDHYEYARYGIPITFFTTGVHSDYHQVTDEPEYIDYEHMARVDNFIADVALHVANLDHRVVVDHPKPDPHGVCQQ